MFISCHWCFFFLYGDHKIKNEKAKQKSMDKRMEYKEIFKKK
jgi:hypothetical protein